MMKKKIALTVIFISLCYEAVSSFFPESWDALFFPPGLIETWLSELFSRRSVLSLIFAGCIEVVMVVSYLLGVLFELRGKGKIFLLMAVISEVSFFCIVCPYIIMSICDYLVQMVKYICLGLVLSEWSSEERVQRMQRICKTDKGATR